MVKKLAKDTRSLLGAGLGLGIGAAVVGGAASSAGVANVAGPAFTAAGGMLGVAVPVVMGGHALRLVQKIPRQKISLKYKKPRRRYRWDTKNV